MSTLRRIPYPLLDWGIVVVVGVNDDELRRRQHEHRDVTQQFVLLEGRLHVHEVLAHLVTGERGGHDVAHERGKVASLVDGTSEVGGKVLSHACHHPILRPPLASGGRPHVMARRPES